MDTVIMDKDIKVFYLTAKSFPEGILQAHQKLHSKVPYSTQRKYFGISRPENGTITYKAAAEEIEPGEAEKYNCETFIIPKGQYINLMVKNYIRNLEQIGEAFKRLTSYPGIDPNGYCIEWYLNDKDVQCMIKLK